MWSSASIPGVPRILMVDLTENAEGWEHAFSDRVFTGLQRSELAMEGNSPQHVGDTASLRNSTFNCLLLFSKAERVTGFLDLYKDLSPFLVAVCTCQSFDPQLSEEILKTARPFAITQLSPVSPREAGLFYLKFFTELKLHSADHLSGKMVWFSFSKAKELLRRRRYPGKFAARC